MSSQIQHIWDTTIDDSFDHAISTPSLDQRAVPALADSASKNVRPGLNRDQSSDTAASYDSGFYNFSSSVATSPPVDSSGAIHDKQHTDRRVQLIWPAGEAHDFALSQTSLPDQHHEKSCARCSLTESEARKCRSDRRREQNRESQRKFRARKEAKIREAAGQVAALETYVDFLEKHNNDLESLNVKLLQRIASFDSHRHVCNVDMDQPANQIAHVAGSERWLSRTSATVDSSPGEMPKSLDILDMHLSPLDHDLLLPYVASMDNRQMLDLMAGT